MPIRDYGVWVGFPRSFEAELNDSTPHLQLRFDDNENTKTGKLRAAINIKSSTKESRLVYWFVRDLVKHPQVEELESFEPGWHAIHNDKRRGLDYIRNNMISLEEGTLLRHNVPGENNDIIDFISPVLNEAIQRKATIYLFGQQFPNGIHDVHMNQGNTGKFKKDNGVHQDGGILLYFPDDQHWEGIFLAFGVQKAHTDDKTGNPINDNDISLAELVERDDSPDVISSGVQIRAALVNPLGPNEKLSGEPEKLFIVNKTKKDISLDNWGIENRDKQSQPLSGVLSGGGIRAFGVPNCRLGNRGGTITLLNSAGLKVDGVSYSKAEAKKEGALVYFH